jgi:hypothetical protein
VSGCQITRWRRRALLVAVGAIGVFLAGGGPADASTRHLTIDATNPGWTPIADLPKGGTAKISVTGGNATCHAGGAVDCPIGDPKGSGQLCSASGPNGDQNNPPGPAGPKVPYGGLAGRIAPESGKKKTFPIGASETVAGPGKVALVFNDCAAPLGYSDNEGTFEVAVTVKGKDLVDISGTVNRYTCWSTPAEDLGPWSYSPFEDPACAGFLELSDVRPAGNFDVELASKRRTQRQRTFADGTFSFLVPKGHYRLGVPGQKTKPGSIAVNAQHGVSGLRLQLCRRRGAEAGLGCEEMFEVSGRFTDYKGNTAPEGMFVSGGADVVGVDPAGEFHLLLTKGKHQVSGKETEVVDVTVTDHDVHGVDLQTHPAVTAGANGGAISVTAAGMLFKPGSAYSVDLQVAAVGMSPCQEHATVPIDDADVNGFETLLVRPTFESFCSGHWTVTLRNETTGETMATNQFDL